MILHIEHDTRYHFTAPVSHGLQRLRLTPKATAGQRVLDWAIQCEGAHVEVEYDDHNYNHVTLIGFEAGVTEVHLRCSGTVDTADRAGVVGEHSGHLPLWYFLRPTPLTRAGPRVKALIAGLEPGLEPLPMLHRLSDLVREAVAYEPGQTDVETPAEAVLAGGRGVCQDHAHVFIAAARAQGLPARYVSGYLKLADRTEQTAGHAWAEAWVQGLGWVGFDAPNEICPDFHYVRVATGRDYREAAPVTGIRFGEAVESLQVRLAVTGQAMEQ